MEYVYSAMIVVACGISAWIIADAWISRNDEKIDRTENGR